MLNRRVLLLLALAASPAFASFIVIPQPDPVYLSSTAYLDLSYLTDGAVVSSVSDGNLTVSLSNALAKVRLGSGWATWNTAPNSQFAAADFHPILVGYTTGSPASVTFSFSTPLVAFGLEAEPDHLGTVPMTLTFFNNAATVGSITQSVSSAAGSMLFAASGGPFTSVTLSSTDDWGVAGLRYAAEVPEPGAFGLLGVGLAALIAARRRRK